MMLKWIAPFTMTTPKMGKAMYLTTMIPTRIESFISDLFNPDKVNPGSLSVTPSSFSELSKHR